MNVNEQRIIAFLTEKCCYLCVAMKFVDDDDDDDLLAEVICCVYSLFDCTVCLCLSSLRVSVL